MQLFRMGGLVVQLLLVTGSAVQLLLLRGPVVQFFLMRGLVVYSSFLLRVPVMQVFSHEKGGSAALSYGQASGV